jgi:hypothetical protein
MLYYSFDGFIEKKRVIGFHLKWVLHPPELAMFTGFLGSHIIAEFVLGSLFGTL